jgi:glycosyltransferase involved in cell wall biosynthesis
MHLNKNNFFYISPSILPSRSANAVHVMKQCDALANISKEKSIYIFAKRSIRDKSLFRESVIKKYSIKSNNIIFITYYSKFDFFYNGIITILVLYNFFILKPKYIISRNLYASFIFSIFFKQKTIFEIHTLEYGFRKKIQASIIRSPNIQIIVISNTLKTYLENATNCKSFDIHVLHDAGTDEISPVNKSIKRKTLSDLGYLDDNFKNYKFIVGYFGHLYEGRGINIIEEIACKLPDYLFLIFGGTNNDLQRCIGLNTSVNLQFKGFVDYSEVLKLIPLFDVLLMPYQNNVFLSNKSYDTAKWMSPMKMFEYLASGVPIISSDLPVLKEVLEHQKTALLVESNNSNSWVNAIELLYSDNVLYKSISKNGLILFKERFTWDKRAQEIINIFENN